MADCIRRSQPRQRPYPTQAIESAAQLRLEDDHERDEPYDRAGLHDVREQHEIEGLRHDEYHVEDDGTDDESDGARPLDEAEDAINQDGGKSDVQECVGARLKAFEKIS